MEKEVKLDITVKGDSSTHSFSLEVNPVHFVHQPTPRSVELWISYTLRNIPHTIKEIP